MARHRRSARLDRCVRLRDAGVAARGVAVAAAAGPRARSHASPAARRLHRTARASRARSIARRRRWARWRTTRRARTCSRCRRRVVRRRRPARVLSAARRLRRADRGIRLPDRAPPAAAGAVRDRGGDPAVPARAVLSRRASRTTAFWRRRWRRSSRWRRGGRSSCGTSDRSTIGAAIIGMLLVGDVSVVADLDRSAAARVPRAASLRRRTCRLGERLRHLRDRARAACSCVAVVHVAGPLGLAGDRAHQRRRAAAGARRASAGCCRCSRSPASLVGVRDRRARVTHRAAAGDRAAGGDAVRDRQGAGRATRRTWRSRWCIWRSTRRLFLAAVAIASPERAWLARRREPGESKGARGLDHRSGPRDRRRCVPR